MLSCPKCGFQQPKDRYCAKCGVNIESYKRPKESAISLTFGILKPIAIFVTILFVIFLALKGLNKTLNVDFDFASNESETTLTIGTQAESIRVESAEVTPQNQTPPRTARVAFDAVPAERTPTPVAQPVRKVVPDQVVSITLAEVFIPEDMRGNKRVLQIEAPQILNSFFSDTGNIKEDVFTTQFEDNLMIYEISVQITDHKDGKNIFKTIVQRSLKTPAAVTIPNIETTDTLEMAGYSIIQDTLPRDQRLQPLTTLLNTLAQSQNYLARNSELSVVVHFEPTTRE